jgi:hypothetical protein
MCSCMHDCTMHDIGDMSVSCLPARYDRCGPRYSTMRFYEERVNRGQKKERYPETVHGRYLNHDFAKNGHEADPKSQEKKRQQVPTNVWSEKVGVSGILCPCPRRQRLIYETDIYETDSTGCCSQKVFDQVFYWRLIFQRTFLYKVLSLYARMHGSPTQPQKKKAISSRVLEQNLRKRERQNRVNSEQRVRPSAFGQSPDFRHNRLFSGENGESVKKHLKRR